MRSIYFLFNIMVLFSVHCQYAYCLSVEDIKNESETVNSMGIRDKLSSDGIITPNDFTGDDTKRIQQAIDSAEISTKVVVIPYSNSNGTSVWKVDNAILLPSNFTLILDNCVLQLSDSCRDNMFRSDNVGQDIAYPTWNYNINIIGMGNAVLSGADNPRSTGDGNRILLLKPVEWRADYETSYGSDAGNENRKQTGDWRNNMIEIAYVNGFKLKNITIKNSHAWAICFERTINVVVENISFYNPQYMVVNGEKVYTTNRDGIDLRYGCKFFRINNITGINGDDLIALTCIDNTSHHMNGGLNNSQITASKWNGPEDDIEQIFISNCKTNFEGVAIRATKDASIHDIYINGIMTRERPDIPPPYGGSPYILLLGGTGWGTEPPLSGKIHDIYAMNLIGDGRSLILINAPISDCAFINGIYTGSASSPIVYKIKKSLTKNIKIANLVKTSIK